MQPEDKYIQVNGLNLHYLDWGNNRNNKQPMILLHGFIAHAHSWDGFAESFHDNYHILALDQRGHGQSEWAKDGAYDAKDFGSDVAVFIEKLQIKQPVIIGHSMGGRNAIMYCGNHPENVNKLIAIDFRLKSDPMGAAAIKIMATALLEQLKSVDEGVQALVTFFPHIPRKLANDLVAYGVKKLPDGKLVPAFDVAIKAQAMNEQLLITDLWPYFLNITCPILIMRGMNSPILPLDAAREMLQAKPNSKLAEIENAGHLVPQENHIAFEDAVKSFLLN
jgi:pimeloyl-ACP methyl ester carboxylesterase